MVHFYLQVLVKGAFDGKELQALVCNKNVINILKVYWKFSNITSMNLVLQQFVTIARLLNKYTLLEVLPDLDE